MDPKTRFYPETRFGGFTRVDGTLRFYERVQAMVMPGTVLLDVGCGRGAFLEDEVAFRRNLRTFKGKAKHVIGIDVDPDAAENPSLDEFRLLQGHRWPVEDESVDLVLADNVLEHVQDPDPFFEELERVLRPGGQVCIRTPNLLSYVGLVTNLVPNRYHKKVVAHAQERRNERDVFPTHHNCNTVWALRRHLRQQGLEAWVTGYSPEPSYLAASKVAYSLGVLYQKLAPPFLGTVLFAFGRKPIKGPGQEPEHVRSP